MEVLELDLPEVTEMSTGLDELGGWSGIDAVTDQQHHEPDGGDSWAYENLTLAGG